jgi:hypothetical protein
MADDMITISGDSVSFSTDNMSIKNSGDTQVLSNQYSSILGKQLLSQKYRTAFDAESTVQYSVNNYIKHAREIHDAHGSYNPSTGRFTVAVDGIYLVYGHVTQESVGTTGSGGLLRHYIRVNGANINNGMHIRVDGNRGPSSTYTYESASAAAGFLVSLNAGDWVSFYVTTGAARLECAIGAYLIG